MYLQYPQKEICRICLEHTRPDYDLCPQLWDLQLALETRAAKASELFRYPATTVKEALRVPFWKRSSPEDWIAGKELNSSYHNMDT